MLLEAEWLANWIYAIRARITISINASGEPNDQDLVTLDLALNLTVADLKGFVEAETRFPQARQQFFFNGQALRDDAQTLEAAGIKDGEMLAMMVSRPGGNQHPTQSTRPRQGSSSSDDPNAADRIEEARQQIRSNPQMLSSLLAQQPELASKLEDPVAFRNQWLSMVSERDGRQLERETQIRLLNEDPFNEEAQRKIAEIIRREKIEENLQYAFEHNPAAFAPVTMLYVPVEVNGHPIKAFVDSGAQSTIMSPSCAEACGISYLIDENFAGIARGVGTAKILGKVHHAKMQVGDAELDCAFTVMEGKDVDLLFGLDMLKRHQACIDLLSNTLRFPHTQVSFLPEAEIPRKEYERLIDEPTVKGPNGTEIGARTGTVRPEGTSKAAHESLEKAKSRNEDMSQRSTVSKTQAAQSAGASGSAGGPGDRYPEADVSQLLALGFSRQEAIHALDATGGNVEYAAGMLFSR